MTKSPTQDNNPAEIFNRPALRHHRDRAARRQNKVDFLHREVADRLADKLADINRKFSHILNIGSRGGEMAAHLEGETILHQDLSLAMLQKTDGLRVQADEEFLPIRPQSLDLAISCLALHWVNDLPGALSQIRHSLKPDGLFVAALFGGDTLTELRQAMMKADIARGGVSPHISPFVDIRDAGGLLQRAGFALPVADVDHITVTYPDAFKLMEELRAMGESNILHKSFKGLSSQSLMMETAKHYHDMFANEEGRLPVTFDILYLLGWAPHESQQKPLKPGSATARLSDVVKTKNL